MVVVSTVFVTIYIAPKPESFIYNPKPGSPLYNLQNSSLPPEYPIQKPHFRDTAETKHRCHPDNNANTPPCTRPIPIPKISMHSLLLWLVGGFKRMCMSRSSDNMASLFFLTYICIRDPWISQNLFHSSSFPWVELKHTSYYMPTLAR